MKSREQDKHAEFMLKVAEKFGDRFKVLDEYSGWEEPLRIECPDHGEFSVRAYSFLQRDWGCLECAKTNSPLVVSKHISDRIEALPHMEGVKVMEEFFTGLDNPVKVECEKHGLFEITPRNLCLGERCPKCKVGGEVRTPPSGKIPPDMELNRVGWLVSKTHRQCTTCWEIFRITTQTMRVCKSCNTARVKSQPEERRMFSRARSRAKERGQEFKIELNDIQIPDTCPVLGIPIAPVKGKSGAFDSSPSLDRIDNSKGYLPGNVQVISQLANAMKSTATPHQLRMFAAWVTETYGEIDE